MLIRHPPLMSTYLRDTTLLLDPKTSKPRRKKIIVAMARSFAVDWWRVRTGRCQAAALGLKLQPSSTSQGQIPSAQ